MLYGRRLLALVLVAGAGVVAGGSPAEAAAPLTVTRIPLTTAYTTPWVQIRSFDLNDAGVVVGEGPAESPYGPLPHAHLWRRGVGTDIAPPGTGVSRATLINRGGDIALTVSNARALPETYLRTRAGRYIRLVPPGALSSEPYDLNDRGDVLLGWRTLIPGNPDDGNPFSYRSRLGLWRNGRLTEITRTGLDVDAQPGNGIAAYVNNRGQVVSLFRTSSSSRPRPGCGRTAGSP